MYEFPLAAIMNYHHRWLKTTHSCSLTVLQARSPKLVFLGFKFKDVSREGSFWKLYESESVSCSVMSDSLPARLLYPWNCQTRILEWVAVPFSRGISLTQGSNLSLLHHQQILYPLSHQGSSIGEGVSLPPTASRGYSRGYSYFLVSRSIFKDHYPNFCPHCHIASCLTLTLPHPSYKDLCAHIEPIWIIQDNLSISRSLM